MNSSQNNKEIEIFREYLRIPSVHPNIDYEPCVNFLRTQANNLELPLNIYYPKNSQNPIVIITWIGSDPDLPTIILNSHMDVVPVFNENWSHPPFGAEIDEKGNIYARGTQDMKCVGMQYLAAIRALKKDGLSLKRTIHVSFVPDEEMGGKLGMREFVHTEDFKKLNIGFSMDEGIASPDDVFSVFYAERSVWRLNFHISGTAGHGSLLHKNTAGEKLHYILNKLMTLRAHEVKRLENNPNLTTGDVTTINLTRLGGGVQSNVVPPVLMAGFDMRLAIDVNHKEFEEMIESWCQNAGGGIEIEYEHKLPYVKPTSIDSTNPFWMAFRASIEELKLKIQTEVFPGGTDSRYIRGVGIPAIGFSPMNHTPVLLHDHDEFINTNVYLRGIEIYKIIISKIANV